MKTRLAIAVALVCLLPDPVAGLSEKPGGSTPAGQTEMKAIRARKKELMKLVDPLAEKLPQALRRRLLIVSMKIYTGYCMPTIIMDFEDAVDALPECERAKFAKEWNELRAHSEWPDTSAFRESSEPGGAGGR